MRITADTKVLGVIGDPVRHSLSPVMHNGWIADHRFDAVYVALPLRSADPATAIRALGQFGFVGLNVTVPHKEAAAKAADTSDGSVANTLRWDSEGSLSAFNTDGAGFLDALGEIAPDWRTKVRRVLIVGAGGAAIGVAHAFAPEVECVSFVNRTHARAEVAARALPNARVLSWENMAQGFADADLIVQATTLGLADLASPDWPMASCKPSAIVADIVYRPLETPFLAAARARGLSAMDGLGTLIHQGARSFEIWFGVKPDLAKARARLMEVLGQ